MLYNNRLSATADIPPRKAFVLKLDVEKLATALYAAKLTPTKALVASGRTVFYEVFHPSRPIEHIITDGHTTKITRSGKAGLIEYEVTHDPSFVLIVSRDEQRGRWTVVRAFFAHKDFVRSKQLKDQLRVFYGPDFEDGALEQILDEAFVRIEDDSH